MGRGLRKWGPGLSVHAIQRGNNRMAIFRQAADYEVYLGILRESSAAETVAIHAYVLMTNHVHLLLTPPETSCLSAMMQKLGGQYAKFFNRAYQRCGTVWNGRYSPFEVDTERYWLTCLRYIEQNPVRAAIVTDPADYRWSTYSAHAFGNGPDWLADHPVYQGLGSTPASRQAAYRALCGTPLNEQELAQSRHTMTAHLAISAAS